MVGHGVLIPSPPQHMTDFVSETSRIPKSRHVKKLGRITDSRTVSNMHGSRGCLQGNSPIPAIYWYQ